MFEIRACRSSPHARTCTGPAVGVVMHVHVMAQRRHTRLRYRRPQRLSTRRARMFAALAIAAAAAPHTSPAAGDV
jgi:hypothetical protein